MAGQFVDTCGVVGEADSTGTLPVADTWQLVEIHVVPGDPLYEVYIDGGLLFSVDETRDPSDANSITAGLFNDFVTATSLAYIADVKVGTTQGASDLFAEDWSGGTFAAWDGTTGTVSVVPAPAFAGSGAHANAMLADSTVNADSFAWKNLASEPEVWLAVVVGFDAAAFAGWTAGDPNDVNSGTFGAVFTDTNPTSSITINGGVYITALDEGGPPAVYEEPLWRFVVTDLDLTIKTILTPLAASRRATFTLNAPAQASGTVPSDSPEVNILQAGHPFLDEGRRCLLGFRREGGDVPWVIRFAGIIQQMEDAVDENGQPTGHSTYTAWDPWKYLYSRPVRTAAGDIPAQAGVKFPANTPANEIATALLDRSLTYDGEHHIMTGNIETADIVPKITFQQGTSVGEAWTQLCEAGYCDIYLAPVYDPVVHPGKLVALNIQSLYTRSRYRAIFSWDRPMRSVHGISRLIDGTLRGNKIQFSVGGGGPSAPVPQQDNFASQVAYGVYWLQRFLPGGSKREVIDLARTELVLLADGLTTYKVNPLAEVVSRPFIDYQLGDKVVLLASDRLRQAIDENPDSTHPQRVYEIPVEIDDDGIERVSELTFVADNLPAA